MHIYFKFPNYLPSYFCKISFSSFNVGIDWSWLQILWQFSHQEVVSVCSFLKSWWGLWLFWLIGYNEILWQFPGPGLARFLALSSCPLEHFLEPWVTMSEVQLPSWRDYVKGVRLHREGEGPSWAQTASVPCQVAGHMSKTVLEPPDQTIPRWRSSRDLCHVEWKKCLDKLAWILFLSKILFIYF